MADNLVTVVGNIDTLVGSVPPSAKLVFKLNRPAWNNDGDIFTPEFSEVAADVTTGAFSIQLQTTDDFSGTAYYTATLKYKDATDGRPREYELSRFVLPAGTTRILTSLFDIPIPGDMDWFVGWQARIVAAETLAVDSAAAAEADATAAAASEANATAAGSAAVAANAAAQIAKTNAIAAQGAAQAAQAAAEMAATNAQRAAYTLATWSALSAIMGTAAGQGAEVLDADTGTHTDPVVGGTVANAGRFTWSASPAGWKWIGGTGLSGKLDKSEISADSGLSMVMVDQTGAPLWVEAGFDGGPTERVGAAMGPKIASVGGTEISDDTGLAFVATALDGSGNVCATDIELRRDGTFSDRVLRSIAARLTSADLTTALGVRAVSGPAITCLGDSLTAGAGGTPYPTFLATMTGRTVTNLGVGGESSRTITGRIGARPWLATIIGGSIPTSGGVTVSLAGDNGAVSPLDQGDAGVNPCSIAGVVGTLTKSSGVYTFTRQTAGSAVPVAFPAPVITAASAANANDILVVEMGQNDATNDATEIINRARAIIDWMAPLKKFWLVSGLSTSDASYRAPYEAQMLAAFGRRFVNLREWLSSAAAMAYVGLTPTSGDLVNIGIGRVPDSLRSDDTHLNSAGYQAKAYLIYQRGIELGYWS